MADAIASVLDYETRLAFRRRTEKGWVPGLPKRKSKSEYSDYGEDGEILSALHSFFDAIKARFANRRNNKSFILTTMSINGEIAGVVKNSGPLLWPGEQGRTPSFIDPTFGLDFSIEEHKERIQDLFFQLVMAKAFRYNENQSRSTDETAKQQSHSADDESGDASEYKPTPRESKKGANKKAKGTGKSRGPYKTQRRLAELRASEAAQLTVENLNMDTGHSRSASVEHATPPTNGKDSPDDRRHEVIDLEAERETLQSNPDAASPSAGRCRKRRATAVHFEPSKRPQRVKFVNRSPPDQSQLASKLGAQPVRPASIDTDDPRDTLPHSGSKPPLLTGERSPSELPLSSSLVDNTLSDLPTNLDVPHSNFSDQIAPSNTLSPSIEVPENSSRQLLEDHAGSASEKTSHHPVESVKIHEDPTRFHESQEFELGTAAAASELPFLTTFAAPLHTEPEQQGTRTQFGVMNMVASTNLEPAAEVNMHNLPNTTTRTCSEPPLMHPRSHPAMSPPQDSLDTILKNTDVRLCLGDVDQVIMDLDGCRTMVDLVERIKLHLAEEFESDHISYVEVAEHGGKEFCVKGMKMKRLRLLPGPGREHTYDKFLSLLTSVQSEDEGQAFRMFVHVKDNRGVSR